MTDKDKGNNDNEPETSSFASIMASVAQMRQDAGADLTKQTVTAPAPVQKATPANTGFQSARTVLPPERVIRTSAADNAKYEAARHTKVQKKTFRSIQVNKNQNGNPLLSSLKDVSYEFNGRIRDVDYLVNSHCTVIFLSLKYHKLHPEYVYHRVKKSTYNSRNQRMIRVLLALVDVENADDSMRELNKLCLFNDITLVTSWSFEQCAEYISALKQSETNAGKSIIQGTLQRNDDMSSDSNFYERAVETLTSIRTINKSDAVNLLSKFGSMGQLFQRANAENLAEVQGMGPNKIRQLLKVINEPFVYRD